MTQLASINPENGEIVGEVTVTSADQIDAVVAKAHQAAKAWQQLSFDQRLEYFTQAAAELEKQTETLGQLITNEMGKPLKRGIGEVSHCASTMVGKAAKVAKALQNVVTVKGKLEMTTIYEPLGVCAAISPWNFPIMMAHDIVIPALMAGNAVVLKPSEETPLSAQAYADVLNQFLPANLLQVVHGDEQQGKALVKSDVNVIAFTGSRAAGINIMNSASESLKRIVLELGGKDPLIVLDDADIEAAAKTAMYNSFENAGQTCVSTERIYVDSKIADAFEKQLAAMSASVQTGPMVNERQRHHVIQQIDAAIEDGARVLLGGKDHKTAYVTPTVLADCTEQMDIMQTETFGPVACISRFDDIEQAIANANSSVYALGASVFGQNEERAWNVAARLTAGMVGVNKNCFTVGDMPWVGAKQSGYGFQGSAAGHQQFTQVRVLSKFVAEEQ